MKVFMRKIIFAFFLIGHITLVYANEYIKNNGVLSLSSDNGSATFSINAYHGDSSGVCNLEGVAESVGTGSRQRNRWAYSDPSSACVLVISELSDGSINVTTRSCESYCGVSAVGSMDGEYRKK